MKKAWIIGEGGLLGSYLKAELQAQHGIQLFTPNAIFAWDNSDILMQQFKLVLDTFAQTITVEDEWMIFWSAGTGTMHSTELDLAGETNIFAHFIQLALHSSLNLSKGLLQFASSAGAVYAGSTDSVITENSSAFPVNPYAREKLKQEQLLEKEVHKNPQLTVLVTRISTLYGNRIKQKDNQGLLAKISHQVVRNQPIHIYVPLETMRDYIHAQDAASCILKTAQNLQDRGGGFYMRLVSSERAYSIAEIISIFKRASHKSIRVIHYAIPTTAYYMKNMQYRSIHNKNVFRLPTRNLLIGIAQLLEHERFLLKNSKRVIEKQF